MTCFTPCLPAVASTGDAGNNYKSQPITQHPGQPRCFLLTSHFGSDMHPIALEMSLSFQTDWITII